MRILTICAFIVFSGYASTAQEAGSGQQVDQRNDLKLLPVIFHQYSAEYKALCHQAFNIAAWRLEQIKKKKKKKLPLAIITDIDETILDNSRYEAERMLLDEDFTPASWKAWTDRSAATLVPGALEFLVAAKKKGIKIFYLSNRDTSEINSTVVNLQKFGLPDAAPGQMIFKTSESSKEKRRLEIMEKFQVVMLLGDNLNDFTAFFEKKNSVDRAAEVEKARAEWGKRFIVLPNVTYGDWENALYNYERSLSIEQKEALLRGLLIH
jgi:5'-nucleotidase (lipoprotein e(P4) family)